MGDRGAVAAGHPLTAEVGAEVLREGGNAVDAGIAAVAASFVSEPLLTGLGAGGYMLVSTPSGERRVLDFFVAAPEACGLEGGISESELQAVEVSFGGATQVFNIGSASVGVYGLPAGLAEAGELFGSLPFTDLLQPAIELARRGVVLNRHQAYVVQILAEIVTASPECAEIYAPGGQLLQEGDTLHNYDLAEMLQLLASEGSEPFYSGEIAKATVEHLQKSGGFLTTSDLANYSVQSHSPVVVPYRGKQVFTNPPPSAGGLLIAYALTLLEGSEQQLTNQLLVDVMRSAQDRRTSEFLASLSSSSAAEYFNFSELTQSAKQSVELWLQGKAQRPFGSTTHISVMDADGMACSVTCTNGEGCGLVVPGTGIHPNNILGEEDLSPLGFFQHRAGERLPSMVAPTLVTTDGEPELVLGSAGSNRIRSAILQTITNVVDHQMAVDAAVDAPRLHFENGELYVEPGVDLTGLSAYGYPLHRFQELNLFFGGVQAVERSLDSGKFLGGGDPRRGGVSVTV